MGKIPLMPTIEDICVRPPAVGEVIDFARWFGPGVPVEMEIGVGKGIFLLNRAKALPERGFFGIEWANKIYLYAADRMARWGLSNVRLMRTDASHFVTHHLPPGCLTVLHIYHPDPWPKKRHHKRRLIQPPFLAAAVNTLSIGGRIAVQTDHAEYFEQIRSVVAGEPRLEPTDFDVAEFGVTDGKIATNFEVKYLREGREIYQLAAIRRA